MSVIVGEGMTVYDTHAHCVPAGLVDVLERDGRRLGVEVVDGARGTMVVFGGRVTAGPLRGALVDMGSRLAAMDAAGTDVQLLASWIDLTGYALDPAAGTTYAVLFNDLLAAEVARHPARLRALATLPLQSPPAAAEELRRCVVDLGMVGVQIATTVDGLELDRAGLDPFWEAAAALRCLVVVHPWAPLAGVDLSQHFLDNLVGRPAETTVALARLMFSGVLDRHPGLNLLVVHGGGFIPYQVGRMQRGYDALPHLTATDLATPPAELAKRLFYDTVVHSPRALRFLIDLVGADRVLLGTDYPFEMGDLDPVRSLDAVPDLTGEERSLIMAGNVSRLLGQLGSSPGGTSG